jgi:hypothetical protein
VQLVELQVQLVEFQVLELQMLSIDFFHLVSMVSMGLETFWGHAP